MSENVNRRAELKDIDALDVSPAIKAKLRIAGVMLADLRALTADDRRLIALAVGPADDPDVVRPE